MNDKTGSIMSKLEETNLMINTLNEAFNNPEIFGEDTVRDTTRTAALLDIAKSLAIIADNTSNGRDYVTCKDCKNYVKGALDEEICLKGHELIHENFYCADAESENK